VLADPPPASADNIFAEVLEGSSPGSSIFSGTPPSKNEQPREPRQGWLDTVSQMNQMSFPYEDDEEELVNAIQEERLEEIRQLLGKEMDPTWKNFMVLRACADQSSVEIAEMIYNWTEPYLLGFPGKLALSRTFENAFFSGRPAVAAFFLTKGASVDDVKHGWIQYAKERNWYELLQLFVEAGVSADEFLEEEQARAARRLEPTPRDREIQNLLNETLVNFGQLIRIAEGLITENTSGPTERTSALDIVSQAVHHKEFLEQRFVDDELTLADPCEFAELMSLTMRLIEVLTISGALNNKANLRWLVSILRMQLFAAVRMRLYP
jgi:hypothetical protein